VKRQRLADAEIIREPVLEPITLRLKRGFMSAQTINPPRSAAIGPPEDSWGTLPYFRRLARVDAVEGLYWLVTVFRPAHRTGHPLLNVEGCPGCAFETAVAR
jgi:hypothetical protein